MIRIRLHAPRGVGPIPNAESETYAIGFTRDVELPAVPRAEETIQLDEGEHPLYWVRSVNWCPDEPDFDVYVVLR